MGPRPLVASIWLWPVLVLTSIHGHGSSGAPGGGAAPNGHTPPPLLLPTTAAGGMPAIPGPPGGITSPGPGAVPAVPRPRLPLPPAGRIACRIGSSLYTMAPDGSGQSAIAGTSSAYEPDWSPDAARLVCHVGSWPSRIVSVNADGSDARYVTSPVYGHDHKQPAWSPDATRVAYALVSSDPLLASGIFVVSPDGSGEKRLTTTTAGDQWPCWSPDGTRIAFASKRDGNWEIYVMNADGSGQARLTDASASDTAPAWSPDGSRIAFCSTRDGASQVFTMSSDGTQAARLTNEAGGAYGPAWSPDGRYLAYGAAGIYVIGADGMRRGQISATGGGSSPGIAWSAAQQAPSPYSVTVAAARSVLHTVSTPSTALTVAVHDGAYRPLADVAVTLGTSLGSVSPASANTDSEGNVTATLTAGAQPGFAMVTATAAGGGNPQGTAEVDILAGRIAFEHYYYTGSKSNQTEIYTMNADGTGQAPLANTGGYDECVTWSPDGSRMALRGVKVMEADGSGRVTVGTSGGTQPAWSPDGSRIAYAAKSDGTYEVYVMNADGAGDTRLTSNTVDDSMPAWSPDGTRIAFVSRRDGNREIYVMNANGSGQTRLTSNSAWDIWPSWSPDGALIAFCSNRGSAAYDVYVMDSDGTDVSQLTSGSASDERPVWSPDGSHIAFHTNQDNTYYDIWVMRADGSAKARLTTRSGTDETWNWMPAWALDPQPPAPYTISATASTVTVGGDGSPACTVTATVRNGGYRPLANAAVSFSTTEGSVDPGGATTDADGQATTTLTASAGASGATVTCAAAGGRNPQTSITIDLTSRANRRAVRLRAVCDGDEALALLTPFGVEADETPGRAKKLRFVPLSRRAARGPTRTWEFAIEGSDPQAEVTLSWPDLAGIGSRDRVALEDLDASVRRSMRTTAAYAFRPGGAGLRRQFRVTAERHTGQALVVTGIDIVPLRSNARAVRWTLSTAAVADVQVLSPSGGVLATIARARAAAAGMSQVLWPGQVRPGIYLLRVTATDDEGTSVRAVRPAVIVR